MADAKQAFVKFLGVRDESAPLLALTIEKIKLDGCHWAVSYSRRHYLKDIQDDDIIFMAWATRDPTDYRIFGWAVGMKHRPGRDYVTLADLKLRPHSEHWPYYIRVDHAEFVAGTLDNGVSLYQMMKELGADSFVRTQEKAAHGEVNINPRKSYDNRAHVTLSAEGLSWISERLQEAFDTHGKVPKAALDQLDWPTVPDL